MPLVSKAFGDIITFTRASSATFTGSNGLIQSATTNTPRFDYDPVTLAARGLLIEEQRTNLLTYSEQFDNAAWNKFRSSVTANATTAPDGTVTADKLVEDTTATSTHLIQSNTLGTPPASPTFSVYLKASERNWAAVQLNGDVSGFAYFDLTNGVIGTVSNVTANIASVGNGWYRCSVTRSGYTTSVFGQIFLATGDNTASYTGNGTSGLFLWGAQLEAGSFATSYIPTVASQVTRSADVASVNTLSPWFNSVSGTLYAEFSIPAATASRSQATFGDGTANERMIISNNSSLTGTSWRIVDGGVDQADINNSSSFANNATVKVAGAYAVNDFATCQGGGTVGTDTSGTLPTVTALYLGSNGAAQYASSHLRRITYYPRKLSSAELQAITA